MNSNKDANRSLVIPKWLPLKKAIKSPENSFPPEKAFLLNKRTTESLNADYQEFKSEPNVLVASDLLSSALVINEMEIVNEVIEYLKKQENVHPTTKNLLSRVLSDNLDVKELSIEKRIAFVRNKLKDYPKNALLWTELGRLYTIKGEKEKAFKAMICAINLAPFTRFVVRSAFRFFLHNNEKERAYYYAKRAAEYSADPWLKSLEVNAAILNDFNLSKLKKFNSKLIPNNLLFHYSELIESIGMIELCLGSDNKAKRNFKLAWQEPSENVIAHGEWIIRNKFPSMLTNSNLDFTKSFEALTWRSYSELQLDNAVTSAYQWLFEEPYSSHPYLACAHMLYLTNKLKDAVQVLKEGLIISSDDLMLRNNLAFTYLKANDCDSAFQILKSYPKDLDIKEKIFYLATSGLLLFKLGEKDKGREFYKNSIELAKKSNDFVLSTLALINLAIAEVEAKSENAIKISKEALAAAEHSTQPNIVFHRRKLDELLVLNLNTRIEVK